ncbi:HAMP domain-containing protein [Calidifontibacillus erzurumensis]|uniref:HAMP domain-containing protein n=1 Tax=Calidifontibacillus erzurumensis TaxID=2741433 RepID=A0A8J8KFB4_9BACI|nr:HAMP domain-containing protein [Calidifontibacillus erzurumensis]NSL52720.1 HAMP domain-containing protein [Calidifontibacillus erzurumensis]
MKLTVSKKMFLGFGAIIALLIILGKFASMEIEKTIKTYDNFLDNRVEKVSLIKDLIISSKDMQLAIRGFLLIEEDESLALYQNSLNKQEEISEKLQSLITEERERALLQELNHLTTQYTQAAEEMIALKKEGNPTFINILSEKGYPLVQAYLTKADEMIAFQVSQLEKVRNITNEKIKDIKRSFFILGIITVLLGIGIAFVISRMISNPVKRMSIIAEKIADGDLTQDTIKINNKDEIGALANAFNDMTFKLKRVLHHINNSAEQVAEASK